MATATVTELNIQDINGYAVLKTFGMSQVSRESVSPTRVERMVTGRLIAVTSPGSLIMWGVSIPYATRADVEWLREAEGSTYFFRTNHGEAFFATINNLSASEQILPGTPSDSPVGEVSFTLSEVTLTVAV